MTKYELRNYRYICMELKQLSEQITTIREKLMSPKNQIITGMPSGSGGNSDRIGEVLSRVDELEKEYINKYIEVIKLRERIENAVSDLDTKERILIRSKYFDGCKWCEIAKDMNYSVENVYKLHGKILQKLKSVQ